MENVDRVIRGQLSNQVSQPICFPGDIISVDHGSYFMDLLVKQIDSKGKPTRCRWINTDR